jgi:hypothetical protein
MIDLSELRRLRRVTLFDGSPSPPSSAPCRWGLWEALWLASCLLGWLIYVTTTPPMPLLAANPARPSATLTSTQMTRRSPECGGAPRQRPFATAQALDDRIRDLIDKSLVAAWCPTWRPSRSSTQGSEQPS